MTIDANLTASSQQDTVHRELLSVNELNNITDVEVVDADRDNLSLSSDLEIQHETLKANEIFCLQRHYGSLSGC